MHTAEQLAYESSFLEAEIAIEKLKTYKSPGFHKIPAELIQAGDNTSHTEIHKLIDFIWNKEELSQEWKESSALLSTHKE
jgi:hypothetical protein